jgi:iron complex outermembrane receptor protein
MITDTRARRIGRAAVFLASTALAGPPLAPQALAQTLSRPAAPASGAILSVAAESDGAEAEAASVSEVVITARHRSEDAQKVPVAVSVVGGDFLTKTNTTNLQQISAFVPSLQYSFFNARNTNINIRGIGNNIGLANDGIEPGVGFYVDGVYYDRPATATFDLVDIDQVEVPRGPQGTLFGKNTTAGAIVITTAGPSFTPGASLEVSGGNLGYGQVKAIVAGPIWGDILAGRLTFSDTTRGGLLLNDDGDKYVNASRDRSFRAQVLFQPNANIKARIIGDYSRQDSNCCDEVLAGIVTPPNGKNFTALAESFGYTPVVDPFDRQADTNSTIQARQETGGVSAQVDWSLPGVTLTSLTAARFWNWWPANDSDYTPLSVLTNAHNGDHQRQFSQEFRAASSGDNKVDYVGGLYLFREEIAAVGAEDFGDAATAFLLSPKLPSIIANGYDESYWASYHTTSLAAFGQAIWHVTSKLKFTGGLRYTYDEKKGWFNQTVSGGVPLTGPLAAFAGLRAALGAPTHFDVSYNDGAISGMGDVSYQFTPDFLGYLNYSRGNKSGGLNLTQLPAGVSSVIQPETLDAWEAGLKTRLFQGKLTLNGDVFWETDYNYQANILDPTLDKQYLSNVPKVWSRGVEIDANGRPLEILSFYASGVYDDAIYASYADGVCGLENVTQPHCNLSGAPLAGVARWSFAVGGEVHKALTDKIEGYAGVDDNYRSSIFSAATDSIYTRLPPLDLLDARIGVRAANGRWDAFFWSKNLTNQNYFSFIAPGVGNTGQLVGQLGDPRSIGVTLRVKY